MDDRIPTFEATPGELEATTTLAGGEVYDVNAAAERGAPTDIEREDTTVRDVEPEPEPTGWISTIEKIQGRSMVEVERLITSIAILPDQGSIAIEEVTRVKGGKQVLSFGERSYLLDDLPVEAMAAITDLLLWARTDAS